MAAPRQNRTRSLPPIRRRSATRVVIILIFAAAGAILLGSIAEPTLRYLYSELTQRAAIAPPPTDTQPPVSPSKPATSGTTSGTSPASTGSNPATTGSSTSTSGTTTGEGAEKPAEPQTKPSAKSGSQERAPDTNPLSPYVFNPVRDVLPFAVLGALLGSWIGVRFLSALERIGMRWDSMDAGDKVTLFVGIFAGLIASVPLLLLFQAITTLQPLARVVLIAAVTLGLSALSVYALQTMSDILPWNRGRGPMRRSGIKLLDTNVIIDGRIYDVAKTGFMDGQMYVPGFVLDELQYIADSHDALRRQRGRRGLETLKHMQNEFTIEVRVHDRLAPDLGDGVDARLVRLANSIGADIVTNDWNLRRVAELQGVHVLSLNDLALALRPNVLPQETLELTINREGNQPGQGVGYLEDGTMVVVENGKAHIGETMEVVVTQVIQTERGKMIFAEVPPDEDEPPHSRRKPRPRQ